MKIHHLTPWIVLTGLVAAQSVRPLPSRGMMTAQSAGMVFENEPSTVVLKGPGLPAILGPIKDGVTAGVPDYSTKAITQFLEQRAVFGVEIAIDAMSTGNDLLPVVYVPPSVGGPVGGEFRVVVPNPSSAWATISLVRKSAEAGTGGADILGYYFENPAFPGQLRNDVRYEAVRADYLAGGFDPEGSDIAALDYAMGQILASQGRRDPGVIESVDRLYFSLTPASALSLQASQFFVNATVDAGTIFRAEYNSAGEVTNLEIECQPVPGLDVDALGVARIAAPVQPPTSMSGAVPLEASRMMYLLSFAPAAGQVSHGYEELLVMAVPDVSIGGLDPMELKPLRWPGGGAMVTSDQLVIAICTRDPDNNVGAHAFGVPFVDALGSDPVFSLEAHKLPGQQSGDSFSITGVVAGTAYPGATVWLGVWHGPGYKFYNLGMWPGAQSHFSFQKDLSYDWVPDPNVGSVITYTNYYDMKVVMLSPGGAMLGVSTTCVLRRKDPL